jgi:Spy/CpxP family protein refolding chaperone
MTKLGVVLALAALVGVACVPPGAANAKADDKEVKVILVERIQDLNLTAEQEAKIANIRKEYRSKVQDAAKSLTGTVKEEEDKIRAVLTPEQQDKVKAMKEERAEHRGECLAHALTNLKELDLTDAEMAKIGEIRKEFHPKIAKAMEGLRGILTDAQRKTREDTLAAGKNRKEVLEALNLTADQKTKVETVGKELATLVREEMEQIGDVLNASQKEQVQDLKDERKERVRDRRAHAMANLKDLNLTDDQKAKIAAIRKEYRPKVHEAGNSLRALVRDELGQVVAIIKT